MLSPKTRTVTESGFDHRLTSSGDGGSAGHDTGAIGLRVKLSRGLKLCKLQERFLAKVNKVNYTVNYKISARARDSAKSRAYF